LEYNHTRCISSQPCSKQDKANAPRQVYVTTTDQAEAELSTFNGPCGIDIEWKPTFVKGQPENPVALIQLANADKILLLHLCHMKRPFRTSTCDLALSFTGFPKNLQTFLEDPNVAKAGVGIQGQPT
jgi:hypothetical protein